MHEQIRDIFRLIRMDLLPEGRTRTLNWPVEDQRHTDNVGFQLLHSTYSKRSTTIKTNFAGYNL